jgi:hypothetical protein
MHYFSPGDENAFFSWLQSIPGVVEVVGRGRELHIRLRSKRLSSQSLRELISLYWRYGGDMTELVQFANPTNESWLLAPEAYWHGKMFGKAKNAV